ARRYFKQNNIAFTEHDIEKSEKARKAYDRLNARGVPVILYGRERMNGFSVAGFKRMYEKK
ncbi:MAG: glutaredoxin family protein, partial [Alcanivoracaceae bacterium]